jgi:hypothetical protein
MPRIHNGGGASVEEKSGHVAVVLGEKSVGYGLEDGFLLIVHCKTPVSIPAWAEQRVGAMMCSVSRPASRHGAPQRLVRTASPVASMKARALI